MTELELHTLLVVTVLVAAGLTCIALFFVTAPYGRHVRSGWGPTIPAKFGWIVMESPAVLLFLKVYLAGDNAVQIVPLCFLCLWQFHYVYRTFIYPFRLRHTTNRMPWAIVCMALGFNSINAYINARWISHFGNYAESWLASPAFLFGLALFLAGWMINRHADRMLLQLRGDGESGYRIPQGGLYRLVSCPNYLGEMLEWIGWAVLTWSTAGLAFAVFSIANLLPRAIANHRWYQTEFAGYPSERKAVIPFVL
ncbi:MAG: DUF1295 domain-containing protein [Gammaproteobacteria bacterium]|nr:DUF1295 domain-containing protein [Gammaproteobacteria bacterium]MDH5302474.1 DUF1295 domain-containing protein [Gammaproteobacteria bacterium]MDH5321356.1 DUF1295 domain-containing protein [Gammaproteobacteria bacterium]